MSPLGRAIRSACRIIYWKCCYGGRLRTPMVQGFDRVHTELGREAGICLGARIQNRGDLYLVCHGQGQLCIGGHVFFNTNSSVTCMGRITIGDYCKFGNNTVIVDHDHNYRNSAEGEFVTGQISIGSRVWVGANCTILKGARIGDDCVIAAGSIVKGEVPSGTMYCQKRQTDIRKIPADSCAVHSEREKQ